MPSLGRTNATLAYLLAEWLTSHDAAETTLSNYRWLAEALIISVLRDVLLVKALRDLGRYREARALDEDTLTRLRRVTTTATP